MGLDSSNNEININDEMENERSEEKQETKVSDNEMIREMSANGILGIFAVQK